MRSTFRRDVALATCGHGPSIRIRPHAHVHPRRSVRPGTSEGGVARPCSWRCSILTAYRAAARCLPRSRRARAGGKVAAEREQVRAGRSLPCLAGGSARARGRATGIISSQYRGRNAHGPCAAGARFCAPASQPRRADRCSCAPPKRDLVTPPFRRVFG